ncbi:MAG: sodium:calcium antiporter, partial [Paludibacteraceae bacterium]|nr:sodium:calcium antiporter [Paludibacteraceae bacterium]
IFMGHNIKTATLKDHSVERPQTASAERLISVRRAIALMIGGLVGLVVGGEFIVRSATKIAVQAGVSEAVIGLTVVALGTSLPELATSCIAAAKKNVDIALGNVVGSNIFNVFFILGTSAVVKPLPAYPGLWLDALMVVLGGVLIWLMVMRKPHRIERWHGAVLLLIYAAYLTYRLIYV